MSKVGGGIVLFPCQGLISGPPMEAHVEMGLHVGPRIPPNPDFCLKSAHDCFSIFLLSFYAALSCLGRESEEGRGGRQQMGQTAPGREDGGSKPQSQATQQELSLICHSGEEKREEMIEPRGTDRQPRNQRVKINGRPKAAGPEETHGERALSGNETSCPCQPFLDSKHVSSGIGIKHQNPVSP